ncbi:hypothetical protein VTI74DRAFT_11252 [Chaetomium olivicolor]
MDRIRACLLDFNTYISPLCPLLRHEELTINNILLLLRSNQGAQKAVALAVCALGKWCLNARNAPSTATRERRADLADACCNKAVDLLKHDTSRSPHLIHARILIAFYRALCGDLYGSERYVAEAAEMLKEDSCPQSPSYLVAYWICVGMESAIQLMLPRRGILTDTLSKMPYPSGIEHDLGDYAAARFLSSVWVYRTEITAAMFPDAATEELEQCFKPPTSTLFDFNKPSSDLATALVQAAWWNAKVAIYMPFIRDICDNALDLPGSHPKSLKKARQGVCALIESLKAFHHVSEGPMIVPNIASTAYM